MFRRLTGAAARLDRAVPPLHSPAAPGFSRRNGKWLAARVSTSRPWPKAAPWLHAEPDRPRGRAAYGQPPGSPPAPPSHARRLTHRTRTDRPEEERQRFRSRVYAAGSAVAGTDHRNSVPRIDGRRRTASASGIEQASAEQLKARNDLFVIDLRSIAVQGLVAADHLPPLAEAKAMLHWHARHRFCSNCGAATDFVEGGWKRICPSCRSSTFRAQTQW